jgi:ribosomal protein S18 acetylase RimI-like enzyme
MSKNFTIRVAEPQDMQEKKIQNLFNQVKREERAKGRSSLGSPQYGTWLDYIERQQNGHLRYQFLVVENNEREIIGFCMALHTLRQNHSTLNKMAIAGAYQRCGIGKELLRRVLDLATVLGKIEVRVNAESGEGRANGFYRKHGFICEKQKRNANGTGTDFLTYLLKA